MMTDPFSTSPTTTVGVVPIFVNAGAALVPTLIAGFTSVLAILLKPRELLALCRRKPWLPAAVLAVAIGLGLMISHLASSPAQAAQNTRKSPDSSAAGYAIPRTDWTALALRLIAAEHAVGV